MTSGEYPQRLIRKFIQPDDDTSIAQVEHSLMATDRPTLRWTLIAAAVFAVIAVAAIITSAARVHDDGSGTPEHTVRGFLVSSLAEHNGAEGCRYLTQRSVVAVQAAEPRGMSCEAALSSYARLTLSGERIDTEGAVHALTYRAEDEAGGRVRVTVSAHGESRTFVLRRGTQQELEEYLAPPSPWRVDTGVDGLLAR